ncbi:MAG: porphobilinogen deaminase, partial [Halobaculum sp.]
DSLAEIERRALGREVDTEYDAIVLAAAGLERLGLDETAPINRLDQRRIVPAPGQGAIAVTALDTEVAQEIYDAIDHPPSRIETTVERTILDELGGGCIAPIGIHALVQGEYVAARVRVLSADGSEEISASRDLPAENHARAAREFAQDLREDGAAELIEEAKRENAAAADDEAGPKP